MKNPFKKTPRTDEETLTELVSYLNEGQVTITTVFVADSDGDLTHEFLRLNCGDKESVSVPEPLSVPLRIMTEKELKQKGITVN